MVEDLTACKLAVDTKDACEAYAECYHNKRENFEETKDMVHKMEKDRMGDLIDLRLDNAANVDLIVHDSMASDRFDFANESVCREVFILHGAWPFWAL